MANVIASPYTTLALIIAIFLWVPGCTSAFHRSNSSLPSTFILVENEAEMQELSLGHSVNIVCPFAHPTWTHNGTYLEASRNVKIKNISEADAGVYSCFENGGATLSADTKWSNLTLSVCSDFCGTDSIEFGTEVIAGEGDQVSAEQKRLPQFKGNQLYKNITRHSGGSAIFNCLPSVNTVANITWFLNGSLINTSLPKAKFKKWSLVIVELDPRDSGTYSCGLCNKFGCVYRYTHLHVVERGSVPPVISYGSLANQTLNSSDNAVFECDVISDLEPHIVWFQHTMRLNYTNDSFNLSANPNVRRMITRLDEPHILRLGSIQKEDEGWYTCVAANTLGETVASAFLKVLEYKTYDVGMNISATEHQLTLNTLNLEQQENDESLDHDGEAKAIDAEEKPPKFKNLLKLVDQLHKPSGSSLQLMCPSTGNPPPNITWTRNDTEIERHIGKVTYKKWSIQMDDAITKDSGVYKCTVCNIHGCIEHSTKVTIFDRLRSRPIISDKFPQNQTVLVNSSATLECRVVSDLEPYIFWLKYNKNNESIEELEKVAQNFADHQNASKSSDVIVLQRDPDKPNLQSFANVTHADEGWYTCVAASSLGQTVASAYLKVVDKLPQREGVQRHHPVWVTTVGVVVVLLFLLGTVFIIYVLRNLKHEKLLKQRIETVHQWTKKVIIYKPPASEGSSCDLQMPVIKIEKQRTTFTTSSNSDPSQGFNEYEFPLDSNWEIPRNQLSLGSTLGEGAFGRVVMAQGNGFPRSPSNGGATTTIVAVKMVKEEHTDADMASLVREMEVMKMIGKHINIINLLGCCSQNGPLWVIVEFAPHGNLKDFLKKNRPMSGWGSCSLKRNSEYLEDKQFLTEKHLISFAFQIARGMEYLASRRKMPKKVVVTQTHLYEAFNTTRPSLSLSDVAKYQKTYARFTNKEKASRDVSKRATLA